MTTPLDGDGALGLAWIAHVLGRDLQRAARAAGGPAALWRAPDHRLARYLGGRGDAVPRAITARTAFRGAAAREALERRGIVHVALGDPSFPPSLAATFDPPFGLFGTGAVAQTLARLVDWPVVAIVGSRRPTAVGRRFASALAADLVARGAVVVSGLARGIDSEAHQGALGAGGVTVAVLGSAVDRVHPRRNVQLASAIGESGAVLSEYWPGTDPTAWRFPARNRIVAGLADAVVVVEAADRSGALITADFALEHGTPVLAVPGWPGAEMSEGCNALIRSGAALCAGADDVVAEIPHAGWCDAPVPASATGHAAAVVAALAREPLGVDRLVRTCALPVGDVATALAELEMDGRVVREPGGLFRVVARWR